MLRHPWAAPEFLFYSAASSLPDNFDNSLDFRIRLYPGQVNPTCTSFNPYFHLAHFTELERKPPEPQTNPAMNQQEKDKQAVLDYWWGFPLNDAKGPKPSPEMQRAMEALYSLRKSENPFRDVDYMCNLLAFGVVSRAQDLGEIFDKYISGMKPEAKLEYIISHIDGDPDNDERVAKRRRFR